MKERELTVIEAPPVVPAPLKIIACANPFQQVHERFELIPGKSLLEILREVQPDIARYCAHVWVGEAYIPGSDWTATYPPPGSMISIRVLPQGAVGRMIGMIFIAIAAIVTTMLTAGALAPAWYAMGVGALAGMAVSIIGNMVLNALIPPVGNANKTLNGAGNSPAYSLSAGSNVINLYGPVPKILGRNLICPNFGARTYTETVGGYQYLRL